jgi:hypothetical protein
MIEQKLNELRAALAQLDRTDPDTDSYAYDQATDQVVAAARQVAAGLPQRVGSVALLVHALRDAIAHRNPNLDDCPDCSNRGGPCHRHAADALQADQYRQALRTVVDYPEHEDGPAPEETGP